jgi:hypothetical protein
MRLLVESGMPLAGGIVGAGGELDWPAASLIGQIQPGLVTVCRLKVKSWKSGRRDPGPIEGSPLCKA